MITSALLQFVANVIASMLSILPQVSSISDFLGFTGNFFVDNFLVGLVYLSWIDLFFPVSILFICLSSLMFVLWSMWSIDLIIKIFFNRHFLGRR